MAATMGAQLARSIARTRAVTEQIKDEKGPLSLEYLGEQIVNYAKIYAPYQDQTGNLRRSCAHGLVPPMESVNVLFETTEGAQGAAIINTDRDIIWEAIVAGMKYGMYVEAKAAYWVLSGAVEHYRPQAAAIVGRKLRFQSGDRVKT